MQEASSSSPWLELSAAAEARILRLDTRIDLFCGAVSSLQIGSISACLIDTSTDQVYRRHLWLRFGGGEGGMGGSE